LSATASLRRLLTLAPLRIRPMGLLAPLVLVGCCGKVAKPSSDTSPPSLSWEVTNRDSGSTSTFSVAGGVFQTLPGVTYQITLRAADAGGVEHVVLTGGGSYTCLQPGLARVENMDVAAQDVVLQPNGNDQVDTCWALVTFLDSGGWDCGAGFRFGGGNLILHGTAIDYFSNRTESHLTLSRGPD